MTEKNEKNEKALKHFESMQEQFSSYEVDPDKEEFSFLDKLQQLVRLILNDSSADIYTAFSPERLEKWKKQKIWRFIKKIVLNNITNSLYFLLLATITGFLVSEALAFYAVEGSISIKTYIKAILTEVCFIFLSGYKTKGKFEMVSLAALRVAIFCLMMFVITSQTISVGTKGSSESDAIQQQISIIETQIQEKEKEIVYYRDIRNWPLTTKQLISEKESLVNKIIALKVQQQQGKNQQVSQVETYKMYGKAAFRIILLFISVLITRRIFTF